MGILQILTLLGALGMFLYGMNLMSSGLQKAAGDKLRGLLSAITSNPFKGVLTGLGITSIIQSSSATTVMVVSFVNAGLLTLAQAIGVIMGSNIGTTITAWILSLAGIKGDNSWLALFKPDTLTPILAFLGLMLFFVAKSSKNKNKTPSVLRMEFCYSITCINFFFKISSAKLPTEHGESADS